MAQLRVEAAEGYVSPTAVIGFPKVRKPVHSLFRGLKSVCLRPFRQQALDESYGLSVGSWCVRHGTDRHKIRASAGFMPSILAIGRTIMDHAERPLPVRSLHRHRCNVILPTDGEPLVPVV